MNNREELAIIAESVCKVSSPGPERELHAVKLVRLKADRPLEGKWAVIGRPTGLSPWSSEELGR
jgi:hypothetical protein